MMNSKCCVPKYITSKQNGLKIPGCSGFKSIKFASKPEQTGPFHSICLSILHLLFTPKKTEHDIKIVKIVNVFKEIRTITILMRKDVRNSGKLVW